MAKERVVKPFESFFERLLWNSRLIVIVAVVASLIVALVMFYIATVDVIYLLGDVAHYAGVDVGTREHLHLKVIASVAEIVDGYLFATIMIIFSLGLYELFISKIEVAERSPIAPRLLLIHSLDDLKERLAKVVFLILIVRYFQYALEAKIEGPLDLLYLAIGVALIALALFLSNRGPGHVAAPSDAD